MHRNAIIPFFSGISSRNVLRFDHYINGDNKSYASNPVFLGITFDELYIRHILTIMNCYSLLLCNNRFFLYNFLELYYQLDEMIQFM